MKKDFIKQYKETFTIYPIDEKLGYGSCEIFNNKKIEEMKKCEKESRTFNIFVSCLRKRGK